MGNSVQINPGHFIKTTEANLKSLGVLKEYNDFYSECYGIILDYCEFNNGELGAEVATSKFDAFVSAFEKHNGFIPQLAYFESGTYFQTDNIDLDTVYISIDESLLFEKKPSKLNLRLQKKGIEVQEDSPLREG